MACRRQGRRRRRAGWLERWEAELPRSSALLTCASAGRPGLLLLASAGQARLCGWAKRPKGCGVADRAVPNWMKLWPPPAGCQAMRCPVHGKCGVGPALVLLPSVWPSLPCSEAISSRLTCVYPAHDAPPGRTHPEVARFCGWRRPEPSFSSGAGSQAAQQGQRRHQARRSGQPAAHLPLGAAGARRRACRPALQQDGRLQHQPSPQV